MKKPLVLVLKDALSFVMLDSLPTVVPLERKEQDVDEGSGERPEDTPPESALPGPA